MLTVIGVMIAGVAIGYILRVVPNLGIIKKLPMLFIFLLLFSLGLTVGANDIIINNLSTIGLQALIITAAAIIGSIALSSIVYKKYFKEEEL